MALGIDEKQTSGFPGEAVKIVKGRMGFSRWSKGSKKWKGKTEREINKGREEGREGEKE